MCPSVCLSAQDDRCEMWKRGFMRRWIVAALAQSYYVRRSSAHFIIDLTHLAWWQPLHWSQSNPGLCLQKAACQMLLGVASILLFFCLLSKWFWYAVDIIACEIEWFFLKRSTCHVLSARRRRSIGQMSESDCESFILRQSTMLVKACVTSYKAFIKSAIMKFIFIVNRWYDNI